MLASRVLTWLSKTWRDSGANCARDNGQWSLIQSKNTVFKSICDSCKGSAMVLCCWGGGPLRRRALRLQQTEAKGARTVRRWSVRRERARMSLTGLVCSFALSVCAPPPAPAAPTPASSYPHLLHCAEASPEISTDSATIAGSSVSVLVQPC